MTSRPEESSSERDLREMRRRVRDPRPTDFDYLHHRSLLANLKAALRSLDGRPVHDVLDVFCGVRPYQDLLPPGARSVGLDVTDRYGVADVVSDEFLPFEERSFDLVICTEAFHYVRDVVHGVRELGRVLRPGGTALITVSLVWEYDRETFEHRWTGTSLAALFEGWDDVRVAEAGGRAVSWATLTGRILRLGEARLRGESRLGRATGPPFRAAYVLVNLAGASLARLERHHGPFTLPMDLVLSARRPVDG